MDHDSIVLSDGLSLILDYCTYTGSKTGFKVASLSCVPIVVIALQRLTWFIVIVRSVVLYSKLRWLLLIVFVKVVNDHGLKKLQISSLLASRDAF